MILNTGCCDKHRSCAPRGTDACQNPTVLRLATWSGFWISVLSDTQHGIGSLMDDAALSFCGAGLGIVTSKPCPDPLLLDVWTVHTWVCQSLLLQRRSPQVLPSLVLCMFVPKDFRGVGGRPQYRGQFDANLESSV
jgi:hypothetical protein